MVKVKRYTHKNTHKKAAIPTKTPVGKPTPKAKLLKKGQLKRRLKVK
jgi:hypothetical protein